MNKQGNFFTEHWILSAILVIAAILGLLAYGGDFTKNIKLPVGESSIQNLLEAPQSYLDKQLEIKGTVQKNGNSFYAVDGNGYKILLDDCTVNRDLVVGESTSFKGYILQYNTSVFICGIFNSTGYNNKIVSVLQQKQLEEQRAIQMQQSAQLAQQQAAIKQAQETRRLEIFNDYKLRFAKLTKGTSQPDAEKILGFKASSCNHQSTIPYGQTECTYLKIFDEKYKLSFTLFYIDDGTIYTPGYSVVII